MGSVLGAKVDAAVDAAVAAAVADRPLYARTAPHRIAMKTRTFATKLDENSNTTTDSTTTLHTISTLIHITNSPLNCLLLRLNLYHYHYELCTRTKLGMYMDVLN